MFQYPNLNKTTIQVFQDCAESPNKLYAKKITRDSKPDLEALNEKGYGIFFSVNQMKKGQRAQKSVTGINAWVCEVDDKSKKEQQQLVKNCPIKPSMIVESKKSYHMYWFAEDGVVEDRKKVSMGICQYFGGDTTVSSDVSRVLRLPGYNHLKDPNDPFLVKVIHNTNTSYKQADIVAAYPWEQPKVKTKKPRQTNTNNIREYLCNLDQMEMLYKISGSTLVDGDTIDFSEGRDGKHVILVNGKPSSCRIDAKGLIGSTDGGGPTRVNWITWYGKYDYKDIYQRSINNIDIPERYTQTETRDERLETERATAKEPLEKKLPIKKFDGLVEAKLFMRDYYIVSGVDMFIAEKGENIYKMISKRSMEKMIIDHLQNKYKTVAYRHVTETYNMLMTISQTKDNMASFYEPKENTVVLKDCKLTVSNGSYTVSNIEPEDHVQYTLPFTLEQLETAGRPEKWLEFMYWMLSGYTNKEEALDSIQRYIGHALVGGNPSERLMILVGSGANGKGVFAKTIAGIVGDQSDATTITDRIEEDYSLTNFIGKTLMVDYEMSKIQLDKPVMKKLASCETMTLNRKYKDHIQFSNKATIVLCTNRDPRIKDRDDSINRRGFIVKCEGDITQVERKIDLHKIFFREEGAGILKRMITGLLSGDTSISKELQENVTEHINSNDPLHLFLEELQDQGLLQADKQCYKNKFFDAFRFWLKKNGHKPRASNTIGKHMQNLMGKFGIREGRVSTRTSGGSRKQPLVYIGVQGGPHAKEGDVIEFDETVDNILNEIKK